MINKDNPVKIWPVQVYEDSIEEPVEEEPEVEVVEEDEVAELMEPSRKETSVMSGKSRTKKSLSKMSR